MSVAHATALLPAGPRLVLRDHAPAEDAAALLALARWAVRFSPVVAPDHPDGLLLDVTGCQRLYGSDENLAALVSRALRCLGLNTRVGVAPTIGGAWAVARFATEQRIAKAQREQRQSKEQKREDESSALSRVATQRRCELENYAPDSRELPQRRVATRLRPVARNFAAVSMPVDASPLDSNSSFAPSLPSWRLCDSSGFCVVSENEWPELFERLPVAALRIDERTVDELAEVGIDFVGQLLQIPRDEIAARFDADLLLRIDQATGEAMEVLRSIRHEEPPKGAIRFAGPTTQLEAVERAVQELVEELCARLLLREAGARKLLLEVERLDEQLRPEWACETLTLSRPSRNARHIWNLLRPRIERLHLGEGVEELSLLAKRTAPLPHAQERFDGTSDESEEMASAGLKESVGQLVDLLESRLGSSAVLAAEAIQMHIPESAFRFYPASEGGLRFAKTQVPDVPGSRQASNSRIHSVAPSIGTTTQQTTSAVIPPPGDRPTILFEKPEPAQVALLQPEGPIIGLQWHLPRRIVTAIGPERIARRWWHFAFSPRRPARDYYRLQDETGLWLWVYRGRYARKWFVHGVWG